MRSEFDRTEHISKQRLSHIRQREPNDCTIATVAAVTNMTYESVFAHCPRSPGNTGLYPFEVRKMLRDATGIKWKLPQTILFRHVVSLSQSKDSLVLFLRQPGNWLLQRITRKMQHCVFVCHDLVFDPALDRVYSAAQYPRRDWIPTTSFRPVDAQQFRDLQKLNYSRFRQERLWSEILVD